MIDYMDLTIAVCSTGIAGKEFMANLIDSTAMGAFDQKALDNLTGYGRTRLEAAANLLRLAAAASERNRTVTIDGVLVRKVSEN